ncbi:hypothetical protein Ndes2526B_g07500 [Nannochloris sp. 'desiccata']
MLPVTLIQKRNNDELALYFRRLTKPKQMDWQYTLWTMLQLLISPKTVYRQTTYHRQTKGGWARDDPAFVVLSCGGVAILSSIYSLIFNESISTSFYFTTSCVFIYYLACGFVLATITWNVANKLLHSRSPGYHPNSEHTDTVDWPFCFDVHCNAMVPLVALLGGVQLMLCPILLSKSRLSAALSCLLYAAGLTQYCYVTFSRVCAEECRHTRNFFVSVGGCGGDGTRGSARRV